MAYAPDEERPYYYDMAAEQDDPELPFGAETARIMTEGEGQEGIIAYCHEANAESLVDRLNRGFQEGA